MNILFQDGGRPGRPGRPDFVGNAEKMTSQEFLLACFIALNIYLDFQILFVGFIGERKTEIKRERKQEMMKEETQERGNDAGEIVP